MSKSSFFQIFILSFFIGITISELKPNLVLVLVLSSLVVIGVYFFPDRGVGAPISGKKYIPITILISILTGLSIGFIRSEIAIPRFDTNNIGYYRDLNLNLEFEGIIVKPPDIRSNIQNLTVSATKLFYQNQNLNLKGKILIQTNRYEQFFYGDLIQITCHIESPKNFEDFSYTNFLAKDKIYSVCNQPYIKLIAKNQGQLFWRIIFLIKNKFINQINKIFIEPQASIISGLLLGERRSIPEDILENFSKVGLTHILAISGYNITLMITILGAIFSFASRKIRFITSVIGITFILLFTGFSASVIRASLMGFLTILSSFQGRKTTGIITLLFSAFIMVFLNPKILLWDISFQLSFAATLGLIKIMPYLEKYFEKLPKIIGEGLAITLSAQVFTTPLIILYFKKISLIAPISNILLLPLIPGIMLFSFLSIIISFLSSKIAFIFISITWLLLKILLIITDLIAEIPFNSLTL